MFKKFLSVFNKISFLSFFQRIGGTLFLIFVLNTLLLSVLFFNLLSFLKFADNLSKTIYEIIVNSFNRWYKNVI